MQNYGHQIVKVTNHTRLVSVLGGKRLAYLWVKYHTSYWSTCPSLCHNLSLIRHGADRFLRKQEAYRLDDQKDKYSISLSLNSVVVFFLTAESFYPSSVKVSGASE